MWRKMVTDRQTGSQTDRNATYWPSPVQGLGWVKINVKVKALLQANIWHL